jgi:hypothetical protein
VEQAVGFTPTTVISRWESIRMGRHHHLPLLRLTEQGEEIGEMQMTTLVSSSTVKSSTLETAAITISPFRHMKIREAQDKLPSSGGQETVLPPGLTIVLSLPSMQHTPNDISPNSITIHLLSHSSYPSTRLTSPPPAHEALAMAHLERILALVRSVVTEATPSSSFTTQAT